MTDNNERSDYFAFISYTEKDRHWAAWLHRHLEYYRIPASLCKEDRSVPKRLRPIFWYKKDLSGTVLAEALGRELDASRFLIVVCSPEAARSVWVNDEVRRFVDTGRADRIIPFIVGGTPHSTDPAEECLPECLLKLDRQHEIRGISVADQGRRHALVDVVATMLGVRFDTLWQRYRRRRRRQTAVAAGLAAVLLLCAAVIGDYTRTRTEYYVDTVDIDGVLQGITRLTGEQVSHRNMSIRFAYRRTPFGEKGFYSWRLSGVAVVNSAGTVSSTARISETFPHPDLRYAYENGKPVRITGKDAQGHTVMTYDLRDDFDGTPAAIIDLGGSEASQASAYLPATQNDDDIASHTKIKRLHLLRDKSGRPVEKTFHSNNDDDLAASAIPNENNVFGIAWQYDSIGRIVRTEYLDHNGRPTTDRYGTAALKTENSRLGSVASLFLLGIDGQPIYGKENYAAMIVTNDRWGNAVAIAYLDPTGQRCYRTDNYSLQTIRYDDRGYKIGETTLSPDSTPVINKYGWATMLYTNDNRGRATELRILDENGRPCYGSEGVSIQRWSYDKNNNVLSLSNYDTEGKPTQHAKERFHRVIRKYDDDGYETEDNIYDEAGRLCYSSIGAATRRFSYDPYHRLTEIAYFDADGKPTASADYTHRMNLTYDNRGNRIREEYYGPDGQPVVNKNGYAVYAFEYDPAGNMTRRTTSDNRHRPIYLSGFVTLRETFSPNGLSIMRRYYDARDSLTVSDNWTAIETDRYDDAGRKIRTEFRGPDSTLCIEKNSLAAIVTKTYDEAGNCIRESYFGPDGQPVFAKGHKAVFAMKYDRRRRLVEESNFGPDGRPTTNDDGIHRTVYTHDNRGNIVEVRHFDTTGRPVADKTDVAHYRYDYDYRDECIRERYFDADGKPVIHRKYGSYGSFLEYDKRGLLVRLQRTDTDGRPMIPHLPDKKIAQERYLHDAKGNIVRVEYLEPDSTLSVLNGYAALDMDYDAIGRPVMRRFTDHRGDPIGGNNFYAAWKSSYFTPDSTAEDFYGIDGKHIVRLTSVKRNGLEIRACWTDSTGKPVVYANPSINTYPYATVEYTYDDRHNTIQVDMYDENGRRLTPDRGHATEKRTFDEKGNLTDTRLFDHTGQRTNAVASGVSHAVMAFDEYGRETDHQWLDADDKPARTPWGYWREQMEYDERGQTTKRHFTLPDGTVTAQRPQIDTPPGALATEEIRAAIPEQLRMLILCDVEGAGQMWDAGFRGRYVVLQFGKWEAGENDVNEFAEALLATRGKTKHIILWRFDPDHPEEGEVFERTFSEAPLTARLMDQSCPDDQLPRLAARKLAQWRAEHPR